MSIKKQYVETTSLCLIFCLVLTPKLNGSQADLPYPYNSIEVLPFNAHAFFGKPQSEGLKQVIGRYNPKIVVEIGSYLGASTRFIAKLLPEDVLVYAVDHWLGDVSWHFENQSICYQQFLSNVIHAKLCHKSIPMKMTSLEAAKIVEVRPDLVFIDGSHDYTSVYEELTAWYPYVKGHGTLCGDDYHWGKSHPVKKAVNQFAREHNLKVKLVHNWFWYFEK